MGTMKEYIDEAERALLHTYNRFQIVLDHGDGVHLYDMDGRNILISVQELQYLHLVTIIRDTTMR